MQFYSQSGEDKYLIQTVFRGQEQGRFLDIGAFDGVTCSNTKAFEDLGWTGQCIEPVAAVYERCCRCRKDCLNKAVGAEPGRGVVQVMDNEQLSGLRRTGGRSQEVDIVTLDSLITQPTHLVSIDTEGTELEILQAYSFEIRPLVFVVEYDTMGMRPMLEETINFFAVNMYRLLQVFSFNAVFIRDAQFEDWSRDHGFTIER